MNTPLCSFALLLAALSAGTPLAAGAPQEESFSFKDAYTLLKKHCEVCHNGGAPAERPVSQFEVERVQEPSSIVEEMPLWKRVLIRVRDEEMPPPGRPAPTKEERAAFVKWLEGALKEGALKQANGAAAAAPKTAWFTLSPAQCKVSAAARGPVQSLR